MITPTKSSFKQYKLNFINQKTTIEVKELIKKSRLSKNVMYVLNTLSHYKKIYGVWLWIKSSNRRIYKLYMQLLKYNYRTENCKKIIDSDLNGS